jgi:hypothetical protein
MSAPELNLLTSARSQVRFDVDVRNFCFEVFFADSRVPTCHDIATS